MSASLATIDRDRLSALIGRERAAYRARFPASRQAFAAAGTHLLGGVPMTWMRMWPGGFPLYCATAAGARLTDIDGHDFIDFCLGDTGAMAGHSPAAVQTAVARQFAGVGGATTMLPTRDAEWVAAELARQITRRPKILVFSYCYHGSVDETFIVAGPDGPQSRAGNVGAPVDPRETTRVV